MEDDTIKTITAQASIVILTGIALLAGYNGAILGFALASLANSGQFVYGKYKKDG